MKSWKDEVRFLALSCCLCFVAITNYRRRQELEGEITSLRRQHADVIRFVQGAQRSEIQRAGERVRTAQAPPRVDQSWVRVMDAWYRNAGLQPPPEGSRLVWHERRLDELETKMRALEGTHRDGAARRAP